METFSSASIKDSLHLNQIGVPLALDCVLAAMHINSTEQLKNQKPEELYQAYCNLPGHNPDAYILAMLKCAVYLASTPVTEQKPDLIHFWNWK